MPVGLNKIPTMTEKDKDRFLSRILFTENPNKCWLWGGSFDKYGYGQFHLNASYKKKKTLKATRISYYIHNNIDPLGLCVCHKCDNPKCCNPNHLFLGTNRENIKDRDLKSRQAKGEKAASSKLKESDIKDIREKYMTNGTSWRKLAREYGVHNRTIGKILHSNTWNHI